MTPCRLLLLDDHPTLTRGLAALLRQELDMQVLGELAHGQALLTLLAASPTLPADLLVLDLHLPPPHDGLSLLPQLRQRWPGLRVLVFSSAASPVLVGQVAAAGAHGFLDKSAEASTLLATIRAIHAGQVVFPARTRLRTPLPGTPAASPAAADADVQADALLRLRQLSGREREIVGLVRAGLSTRDIAGRLSLSELTVSTHRRNLLQKLGVRKLAELLRFAHEHGL